MENCLYNGEVICAYDIIDPNGTLNYELSKRWRIAARNGELICPECSGKVGFKGKDIEKKSPHFFHLEENLLCPTKDYEKGETNDHIRGKMILYNYFKNKYPTEKLFLNHTFPNRRRCDLYIEFKNGDKLAVEYQRTSLFITDISTKNDDYIKSNINSLWLLNGTEETIKNRERQSDISFFEQSMLNEWDKTCKYLDVKNKKLILSRNMKYINPYKKNDAYEELFIMSYSLDEIMIKTNGEIDCSFLKNYNIALSLFTSRHAKRCLIEEQSRLTALENAKQILNETQNKYDNILSKNKCFTKHAPYAYKIHKALRYDDFSINSISKYIRDYGSSDDDKALAFMFQYHHSKGNHNSIDVYNKIMDKACMSPHKISDISLKELSCPFCNSSLVEHSTVYGSFVSCSNNKKCKLTFKL